MLAHLFEFGTSCGKIALAVLVSHTLGAGEDLLGLGTCLLEDAQPLGCRLLTVCARLVGVEQPLLDP